MAAWWSLGNITLDVNATRANLSSVTLGAGINRFDVASGATLTLSSTQLTGTMKLTGSGNVVVNSVATDSTINLSSIVDDTFTGSITINDGTTILFK